MKREIKFRAFYDGRMHDNKEAMRILYNNSDEHSLTPKYPIMQFTGLHDINNKEVYEGDILSGNWQVHFYRGMFVAVRCGEIPNMDNSHQIGWVIANDAEVIGNQFEHPHLIQKEVVK